jgi:hypothetical protein
VRLPSDTQRKVAGICYFVAPGGPQLTGKAAHEVQAGHQDAGLKCFFEEQLCHVASPAAKSKQVFDSESSV